ncbi:MAG: YbdK family carboxylate-amine ligase [Deltaproteobacteria bacterium]|jgi:carboxylate-amine ligase|nr:YbdK family carboxylate-amine ligase [Deltaproteobacteria bacterium]
MTDDKQIEFQTSRPFTLGVEIELQVLDKNDLNLVPKGPDILAMVPAELQERIKREFIRSMIEINTEVCSDMEQVKENLNNLIKKAEDLAAANNCILFATSLHPFAKYSDQELSSHPRYSRIMNDLQLVGRRFITQGLHVHVGMEDHESAIRVCDSIRLFLPILLALTCSSPYYEGIDTGLHSYRAKLFEALPLAGMPDELGSWDKYIEMVNLLTNTGIISEVRDLWWDVRPHPDFGTIEIRICDLPSTFNEILAIVALIQGLVVNITESDKHLNPNMQVLKSNKWQAARYGLEGRFVYPLLQKKISMKEAAAEIFAKAAPAMEKLGTSHYLSVLQRITESGTSSSRQRNIFNRQNDFTAIIKELYPKFWQ